MRYLKIVNKRDPGDFDVFAVKEGRFDEEMADIQQSLYQDKILNCMRVFEISENEYFSILNHMARPQ